MPIISQPRSMYRYRATVGPTARSVRVHVAAPGMPELSSDPPVEDKGQKNFFTDGLRSVFQTERAKDLNWKSNQFTGKIEHDEHHIRSSNNGPAAAPKRSQPLLALPAPSELTVTFKRYVVEMIEKVANSKDADANEPEWKVNEFKGRISHRRDGDHHGH